MSTEGSETIGGSESTRFGEQSWFRRIHEIHREKEIGKGGGRNSFKFEDN